MFFSATRCKVISLRTEWQLDYRVGDKVTGNSGSEEE